MKRIYTLLSVVIVVLMANSAKAQIRSYLGFFGGVSVPQGDFGRTNYDNNQAGFAKRGVTFGMDGAVYVYKKLAIAGTISFNDQGEMTFNDVNTLATGYTASYSADQSTVTAVNRYHNLNVLIGPQYSFQFHNFILDLRASAGIIKVTSTPEITTSLTGVPTQTAAFYQRNAKSTVFGYGGNVGLRYKLGDSWTIGVKGAYIESKGPNITNDGHATNVGRLVTKQPMSVLQTTIGIAFSL